MLSMPLPQYMIVKPIPLTIPIEYVEYWQKRHIRTMSKLKYYLTRSPTEEECMKALDISTWLYDYIEHPSVTVIEYHTLHHNFMHKL